MKRIKIWLNSFTLIQQYVVITFLAILIFALFILKFLNGNIDNFTNQQMYSYMHRSQISYADARRQNIAFNDTNVYHNIYNPRIHKYLYEIPNEMVDVYREINPIVGEGTKDDFVDYEGTLLPCSVSKHGDNYIVSVIKDAYRLEFRTALVTGTVNSSIIVIAILFVLIMVWVYSLIYPLNSIRNYIQKIRNNEQGTLLIKRNDEIGEVAEAVVSMNDELSKQQRIREEMIQNISHDLKTPIATIKSYSESIKDGVYPYDTLEKSVDVIIEHADRLEKKVYSLIAFNKIGYLQDVEKGDNLLMAPLVEKAILSCRVLRNDVVIDTSEVEDNIYFHGDEDAWRTVLENLLDNGLRYAKSKVSILLSDNLLEVYNDGEIMSKDRIEKLFKPYEKGTKGNFGLGLSIVKRVCDTYGYSVLGENRNDGVVFRIYRNVTPSKTNKKVKEQENN